MDIKPVKQRPVHHRQQPRASQIINNITVNQPTPASFGILERDWMSVLLLSIFLGWLGIDQFYLGKTGKGILKLFTFGLFGILWIIDITMIATKSVNHVIWKEATGNWFKQHKIWTGIIVLFLFFMLVGIAGNSK